EKIWASRVAFAGAVVLILAVSAFFVLRSSPTRNSASNPPLPEKSIAVLPFENLSNDREDAAFADGVQDDILTKLARIADLKVISRTSVSSIAATRIRTRSATRFGCRTCWKAVYARLVPGYT